MDTFSLHVNITAIYYWSNYNFLFLNLKIAARIDKFGIQKATSFLHRKILYVMIIEKVILVTNQKAYQKFN